ncbi:hypothetical protein ACWC2K_38610 [Streptomyces chattanoogensis]
MDETYSRVLQRIRVEVIFPRGEVLHVGFVVITLLDVACLSVRHRQ